MPTRATDGSAQALDWTSSRLAMRLSTACTEAVATYLGEAYEPSGWATPPPAVVPPGYRFVHGDAATLAAAESEAVACETLPAGGAATGRAPVVVLYFHGGAAAVAIPG